MAGRKITKYTKYLEEQKAKAKAEAERIEKGFNAYKDKIVFEMTHFTLLKNTDFPQKVNEVYFVPIIIDFNEKNEIILWNETDIYPVRKNQDYHFENSAVFYGPSNPGELLNYRILVYESDTQKRQVAKDINRVVNSQEYKKAVSGFTKSFNNNIVETSGNLLGTIAGLVSSEISKSKDKLLATFSGTLFRDHNGLGKYRLKDPGWTEENPYIRSHLRVRPY